MIDELRQKKKYISVTGLGYVGLPLALELARHFRVIGFDISAPRVEMMQAGKDPSRQLPPEAFQGADIAFTAEPERLEEAHFHIIAVPTPVDAHRVPELEPLFRATRTVAQALKRGDCVVYESTVYPGCTEEDCLPILEEVSGLKLGRDFKLGYSPERINPGDRKHTLRNVVKVVAANDEEALDTIAAVYETVVDAGIHKAPSIKVAEAAKVIENTQRDINISLMNELSIIFDKLGIDTKEVLEAAATKWNFLRFHPGLVGGHCIGVDPYYLVHKARQLGYEPQVILSGRHINDYMPAHVAKRLVQLLIQKGKNPRNCKVLVMGFTFKENVADIRNSKVADLVRELMDYSLNVHIVDPLASPNEVAHEYKLTLMDEPAKNYDAVILAVDHDAYKQYDLNYYKKLMNGAPILMDLKGMLPRPAAEEEITYWRL